MSLYTFCLAGGGFVLIGAWEVLTSSYAHLNPSPSPSPSPKPKNPFFSTVSFISISLLSFFFIINSSISSINALESNDKLGFAFQLEIISISSLFLLYSIVGFLNHHTNLLPLPSSIPNLISLFAFGQEFIFFYLRRKDPNGTENQYFGLLLVPIMVCVVSTFLDMGYPRSNFPNFVRGVGLILHGTWLIQMGFSFFTDFMVHGCVLHKASRGNFTVKCKGHMEEHRSKAIATLQFNCHLALLVILILSLYSLVGSAYGFNGDYANYKQINGEMQNLGNGSRFTLDSEDDEEEGGGDNSEITVEEGSVKENAIVAVSDSRVNGFGAH